uniref:GUN4-like domain-containing protein n=1 Tax=Anotrichium furcellatum TaxID=41999 RepID=A0A4D6WKB9_9FLOR|nr:hypothetical protein [Anotrichium furcellatum]
MYNIKSIYDEINQTIHEDTCNISQDTEKLLKQYLENGEKGCLVLLNLLILRRNIYKNKINVLDGIIFNYLQDSKIESIVTKLNNTFPEGIVPLKTSLQLNYAPLQKLLTEKKFQDADKLTQKYLCQLAGLNNNNKRKWLYFTDVSFIPSDDLFIIDLLWRIYSKGKFGFSVQRKIWMINNYKWDKLWNQIGWLKSGNMRRYPHEFIWTINAPKGHLPLFNQLRGNQVLFSLFEHIVWKKNIYIN